MSKKGAATHFVIGAYRSPYMRKHLWLQKLMGLLLHDAGDGYNLQLVLDR